MTEMKTVADYYNIRDIEIQKLAESKSEYYLKVRDFWHQVKDLPMQGLSPGRCSWLDKIETDIAENWRDKWIAEDADQEECF